MAPPGRRRDGRPKFAFFLALILLFFTPSILAAGAVLGLDLGTEYIKAALVKPGIPLEIVLTKDSKRKETSAIAFKPVRPGSAAAADDSAEYPERVYGSDALALAPRFPTDVFPNLKHLLGASPPDKDGAIRTYSQRYPGLEISDNSGNGTITFNSKSFGNADMHTSFSVEELLAMVLKGIRENAETMAGGSTVREVVITIPTFYTADERRAVELAAELAGLKVLELISDGLAVGLNYATSRTFAVPDSKNQPEYHLVYDMGAGSTTATLLRMQGKQVKDVGRKNKTIQEVSVVGVGWDRSLGGDALNDLIVNDMAEKFVDSAPAKKAGIELNTLKSHGRAMVKLWREAERVRQVLSANTATSGFFEGLLDDVDFRYKLARTDFEALASDFASRIGKPVEQALQNANLGLDQIKSVILHGGAVRTPFVQSSLESQVGDAAKLRGNVNADEAAVFGAAFRAAGASPNFKVKEIRVNEVAGYAHSVHWTANNKPRTQQVFFPTSQVGPAKQMPFKLLDDFGLSISQKIPSAESEELVDRPIVEILTSNLTETVNKLVSSYNCARENISTTLFLRLDPVNSLPELSKGILSCEGTVMEKKAGVMDGVKGMLGFGKKSQKTMTEDGDDEVEVLEPLFESSVDVPIPTSSASTSSASSTSGSSKTSSKTSAAAKTTPVKKLTTIPFSFNARRIGRPLPTESELRRMKDSLASFERSDHGRRLREELFNALESFSYKVRDMLTESSFVGASTDAQRAEIETLLGQTTDWLHGEGGTAGMEAIKEKLTSLKALVDPVTKRKDESSSRPSAVAKLNKAIGEAGKLITQVKQAVDKAAEEAASVSAAAAKAAATMSTTASEQSAEEEQGFSTVELDSPEEATAGESSSTTTTSTAPKFTIDPSILDSLDSFNKFNDADLKRIQSAYESASTWLSEKTAAQSKLAINEDPVLTTEDLEKATEQLVQVSKDITRKSERIKNAEKEKQKAKEKAEAKKKKDAEKAEKARKQEEEKARKAQEKADAEANAAESPEDPTASEAQAASGAASSAAPDSSSSGADADATEQVHDEL